MEHTLNLTTILAMALMAGLSIPLGAFMASVEHIRSLCLKWAVSG